MRRAHRSAALQRGRRRRLADLRGVTDVPLELLIIVIILAIVIPIIVAALITYSTAQANLTVEEQASNLRDVAVQAFDDGINTTLLVSISLPGGGVVVAGGALWVAGGYLNYQSAYINWGSHNVANQRTLVENGAQDVLLTNITCNYPSLGFNFHSYPLPPGNSVIALTKIAPGAFFCGQPWPPVGSNASAAQLSFVEVQAVP